MAWWRGWVGGLKSWQWLLIIEGSITVAIPLLSIFILPDFPATTRWPSEEERKLAADGVNRPNASHDKERGPYCLASGRMDFCKDHGGSCHVLHPNTRHYPWILLNQDATTGIPTICVCSKGRDERVDQFRQESRTILPFGHAFDVRDGWVHHRGKYTIPRTSMP